MQIVFDADGISGNGNDWNILVGETVYGGNWWLSNGSTLDQAAIRRITAAATAPPTTAH